jgi:phosphoglycolate phosphatase-like HAD superfamily hydrolase
LNLTEIFLRCDAVLLDFDGPVGDLFPRGCGSRIAEEARTPVRRVGVVMPEPVASTVDHLEVLGFAAVHAPGVLEDVERAAIAGEVESAKVAPLTVGVREFLSACGESGRRVAIVSNNAVEAIEVFLELHGLRSQVAFVLGRPLARPELMKPDPGLGFEALRLLGVRAERACMVGDSVTDVEFAHRAGVVAVGYAKHAQRGRELAAAGADAVVHSMKELLG